MNERPRDRVVPALVEGGLALLVAFGLTLGLGLVSFTVTAFFVETDGPASLIRIEHSISVPLAPADPQAKPTLAATREVAASVLPEARSIAYPTPSGAMLLGWQESPPAPAALAALVRRLQELGWESPVPSVRAEKRAETFLEDPARIRSYLPPMLAVQALAFLAVAAALVAWRQPACFWPRRGLLPVLGWGVLAAAVASVSAIAIGTTLHLLGLDVEEQTWIQALLADRSALLAMAPWLVVIGPFSEEVFFRGYLFRRLHVSAGAPIAYAATAISFALVHFNFFAMPVYAAVGLCFAYAYRRTGRLEAAVVAHMVYNGFGLLQGLLVGGAS